ncbi:putative ntf2 and rrm domain-containing protein [Staphylotrichum tortipilum]|uniref:Ntf2 and rrm domain-containing protein n=1 Tax=Staphylotrichum tortipilum TaxID=2831512 RepID=A0AAN6MG38_9PEZI|nr:putative ntf2 and rrm domain-containing protein [Staphylotrichum longicolle]
MATNGNISHHEQYAAPAQTPDAAGSADSPTDNLPKVEVGWYFVEQYYTTMSKSPERLHLFYGKKAQFVCGREAEVADVSFGRHAIQERIKGMDFQDRKVRISNVDTQGSEENILITVIGEMANKSGEPKKFVQTFVLAQQPSGYFVLNDMLRYINEDVEEEDEAEPEAEETAAPAEVVTAAEPEVKEEAPAAEEPAQEQEAAQLDAEAVTEKLAEAAEVPAPEEAPAPEPVAEAPKAAPAEEVEAQPEQTVEEEIAEEEAKKPEEPKDPAPTPSAAPAPIPVRAPVAAPAPAQPEKPKEPPKPMSWASRVAAGAGAARPVAPVPKTATPPAPAQARAPVPAAPQQAAPPSQQQESAPAPAAAKDQGEWQTAETKRQSRAQPPAAAPAEKDGTMAYIKYVTDKVKEEDLRSILIGFGELAYFDINRQKNCAFVEFKTQAGYSAAMAANPLTVNGESVVVEQRRPKANAYGGANYNAARGGAGRGGRGGFEPTRSGSQSGRGGFTGQPRGGRGGGPRGRGASQVGAA